MAVSMSIFILVTIFGSVSWLGTNSVWMQLPLLTADLPEGWGLPSFLAAIVQVFFCSHLLSFTHIFRHYFTIACVGPLVYTILHKGCQSISLPTAHLITAFLVFACACQFGLVFMWWWTIQIGSGEYSIALYLLLFGLALVNATSNVLFMPFMARFHHAYLNAYFVGMGLSSLIPSLLSLVQGAGKYDCEGAVPLFSPPRFQASAFFFVIFVWTVVAMLSFEIFRRSDGHNSTVITAKDAVHEGTPLRAVKSKSDEEQVGEDSEELNTKVEVTSSPPTKLHITATNYAVILIETAVVNALMNGVIPSVQSYSALPYSQDFFRSLPVLTALTVFSSLVTAFIIYLATLSPDLIFNSRPVGSVLSVGLIGLYSEGICSAVVASGTHSYLRVVFASLLRESEQSENRLFWCGVFIQVKILQNSLFLLLASRFLHGLSSNVPSRQYCKGFHVSSSLWISECNEQATVVAIGVESVTRYRTTKCRMFDSFFTPALCPCRPIMRVSNKKLPLYHFTFL
ncbi:hypothetical protein NECAME_03049 [Necator americanus]|uniref:Riboflavin transporter n=1 Tax=Necator americanus TaxID=51031 RepID=W2TA55_NECAM|nr:hypothetical protein NECAME_03049 [Necator americanus]ETN77877.1 hypothetical protein NECAME_03049 [Necator americanus]